MLYPFEGKITEDDFEVFCKCIDSLAFFRFQLAVDDYKRLNSDERRFTEGRISDALQSADIMSFDESQELLNDFSDWLKELAYAKAKVDFMRKAFMEELNRICDEVDKQRENHPCEDLETVNRWDIRRLISKISACYARDNFDC